LDYRKNIEEKVLNEFSEKKRQLEREKIILKNLVSERLGLIDELKKMLNKLLPVDDIALYVSYVEKVRKNEQKQKKVIAQVKEQLEALRKELLEAVKKAKVMEKLKEKHSEEYDNTVKAFERLDSDEMAVLKFGRREK
jgi:flagellar protein FliJ